MNRAGTPHAFSTRRPQRFTATQPRATGRNLARPGLTVLMAALPLTAGAQTSPDTSAPRGQQSRPSAAAQPPLQHLVTSTVTSTQISAESAPYHLEWNGTTGTLVRSAFGIMPEQRLPLEYLHTEPGPKGYAKYLTWFLARDNGHFSIVWCYLNDSGREFQCWLYQYPTNQLTTLRFVGDYRFVPSPEPTAPAPLGKLDASVIPLYNGPDFTYHNWTRRNGTLDSLSLSLAHVDAFATPPSENEEDKKEDKTSANSAAAPDAPVRTLSNLRVAPLHELHVAKGNGWRTGGWRELHALAYDGANDPYYLIMYSNATKGYVIDLKTAQTFVADFGQRVVFKNDNSVFGAKEETVVGPPDMRVRRFARLEIPLVSTRKMDNPYTGVYLDMDFRSPDGRTISVPGFWDGEQTWRVRFAPTQVGNWSWSSRSDEPELHNQTGSFVCIADDLGNKGFVSANTGLTDRHGFAYSNNAPFYPVFLREPVHYLPGRASADSALTTPSAPSPSLPGKQTKQTVGETLLTIQESTVAAQTRNGGGMTVSTAQQMPRSYQDFMTRVDQAAALHFNRFWGGYLLDPVQFPQHTQANEGGAPFVNYDLNALNPAYFKWMDRRVAYCNERGIIPDISLGDLNADFMAKMSEPQLLQLWRYVVARYAAFDVNWNLFGLSAPQTYPASADLLIENLARLTRRSDPLGHPISTVVPNVPPLVTPAAPKPSSAPVTITPDGPPSANFPILPGAVLPPDPGAGAAVPGAGPAGGNGRPGRGNRRRFNNNGNNNNNNNNNGNSNGAPLPNAAPGSGGGGPFGPQSGFDPTRRGAAQQGTGVPPPFPPSFPPGGTAEAQNRGGGGRRRGLQNGSTTNSGRPGVSGETNGTESSSDYVVIADPTVAAAIRANRKAKMPKGQPVTQPLVRYGRSTLLNVITLLGGDPGALAYDYRLDKPLVFADLTAASAPDSARYRLWETAMRGAFWAAAAGRGESGAQPLDSAITRSQSACANLFRSVQYNRLLPHQDMLGGPEESVMDRRRRHRAEMAAGQTGTTASAPDPALPSPPPPDLQNEDDLEAYLATLEARAKSPAPGPIYVLADPGWEYVVYFQHGGTVTLDLLEATGPVRQSWYNPRTGEFVSQQIMSGGLYKTFTCPDTNDWVLYLNRR